MLLLDTFSKDYADVILVGDINVDVRQTKRHSLSDVFEVNGLKKLSAVQLVSKTGHSHPLLA